MAAPCRLAAEVYLRLGALGQGRWWPCAYTMPCTPQTLVRRAGPLMADRLHLCLSSQDLWVAVQNVGSSGRRFCPRPLISLQFGGIRVPTPFCFNQAFPGHPWCLRPGSPPIPHFCPAAQARASVAAASTCRQQEASRPLSALTPLPQ